MNITFGQTLPFMVLRLLWVTIMVNLGMIENVLAGQATDDDKVDTGINISAEWIPKTVFLVRHAEKASQGHDPELTIKGVKRAKQLVHVLKDAKLSYVYSTEFKRTLATAAPVAEDAKLPIYEYHYAKLEKLAVTVQSLKGNVLIVGHSNTTPEMVKLLGGKADVPIDEESEFSRLYVLTLNELKEVSTITLHYGE